MHRRFALTVDFDANSIWREVLRGSNMQSGLRGSFGETGALRLLDLYKRQKVKSTWFIPVISAKEHPNVIERVVAEGHEIGLHGLHTHTNFENAEEAHQAIEFYKKHYGIAVVGSRAPCLGTSNWTNQPGPLIYDSSVMDTDYEALQLSTAADLQPTTSRHENIVSLPVSWHLDDFPAREFNIHPYITGLMNGELLYNTWVKQWRWYRHSPHLKMYFGGMPLYTHIVHPQCVARGGELLELYEKLIEEMVKDTQVIPFLADKLISLTCRHHAEDFLELCKNKRAFASYSKDIGNGRTTFILDHSHREEVLKLFEGSLCFFDEFVHEGKCIGLREDASQRLLAACIGSFRPGNSVGTPERGSLRVSFASENLQPAEYDQLFEAMDHHYRFGPTRVPYNSVYFQYAFPSFKTSGAFGEFPVNPLKKYGFEISQQKEIPVEIRDTLKKEGYDFNTDNAAMVPFFTKTYNRR